MTLRLASAPDGLGEALVAAGAGPEGAGLVLAAAVAPGDGWEAVEEALVEAFELTRDAYAAAEPVVYVVRQRDLLGQDGALGAMLSCALLSAARALATEDRDSLADVNVVAYDDEAEPAAVARWVAALLDGPGVTGELIRVGRSHLGRIVP